MSDPEPNTPDIHQLFADGQLIDAVLREAVAEALLRHKRAGNPIAECVNGHVVWLPPDQIPEPKRN